MPVRGRRSIPPSIPCGVGAARARKPTRGATRQPLREGPLPESANAGSARRVPPAVRLHHVAAGPLVLFPLGPLLSPEILDGGPDRILLRDADVVDRGEQQDGLPDARGIAGE